MATITDVAFSSDGKRIFSASNDKTVRVWNVASGKTNIVIRGAVGEGREGQIYALAVSPDDATVSVGGWFGGTNAFQPCCGDIRRFDVKSGKLRTVFKGHTGPVTALAYEDSNGRLLSGSSTGEVFLWAPSDPVAGSPEASIDATPIRLGEGMSVILKVGFLTDGKTAVAVARNGEIAFFDLEQQVKTRSVVATSGNLVAADIGRTRDIVVVADQRAVISIWSSNSGDPVGRIEGGAQIPGSLSLFSGDTRLLVTCGQNCSGRNEQLLWDIDKSEIVGSYPAHDNVVKASAVSPDGLSLLTAGGSRNELHIWRPGDTAPLQRLTGVGAPVWAASYVPETRMISWGSEDPCPDEAFCPERERTLGFGFRLPRKGEFLDDPQPVGPDGVNRMTPATEVGEWRLQGETGGRFNLPGAVLKVLKSGAEVAALEKEATNGWANSTFAISRGDTSFFAGDYSGGIMQYGLPGVQALVRFSGGHDDTVLSVSDDVSENIVLSGGRDQRLAIWNRETGELIANMLYADDGNWIIWVPQGYYYSSPDGDRLVGWQVNQGNDREARYLTARQLRRHLFSPEIIRRALELKSARLAIEDLRPSDTRLAQLLAKPAPAFSLEVVKDDPTVPDGYARVRIRWDTAEGRSGEEVTFFTNNRLVETASARALTGESELEGTYDVKLSPGDNAIHVNISNEFGYVTERGAFDYLDETEEADRKGRLFVVVVGVDNYPMLPNTCSGPNGSCNLKYAVKDASAFLETVIDRVSTRFVETVELKLVNGGATEPTADNIQDEVEYFLEEPGEDDMTLIFFAGHGVNIGEDYYFVPTDGEKRAEDRWRTRSLVEWRFLRNALEKTKGTRLLFLDTCHSGNAYNSRLVKDTADARVVVFSAAKSNQFALETQQMKHGLFTYSLVNGLNGAADLYKDQSIRLLELATFVSAQVNELSNNRQSPEYYLSGLDDFLLSKW
ncbi:caspase family protein [Labrenzia sp. MBR-25]